jgi:hypothetical protein
VRTAYFLYADELPEIPTKLFAKSEGFIVAEREGFEPSIPFWGIPDFESGAFNHSATSPWGLERQTVRADSTVFLYFRSTIRLFPLEIFKQTSCQPP